MRQSVVARATLLLLSLAALPAPAAPLKPAAKPAAAAKPAGPAKSGKGSPKLQRARQLLVDAGKVSKIAAVKQGVAESLVLLEKKQFKPAQDKVSELKRTAALGGDGDAALKLVSAEDALSDLVTKVAKQAAKKAASKGKPKK